MGCETSVTPWPLIYTDAYLVLLFHILINHSSTNQEYADLCFFDLGFFASLWHILDLISLEGRDYPHTLSLLPNKQVC